MYAHLVTISNDAFIVKTLNKIPAEQKNESAEKIAKQLELIRTRIIDIPNVKLVADVEAWKVVTEMGSDLSINAFAANFKINGTLNTDVVEVNHLNKAIFNRLSITTVQDNLNDKPLILTSTVLSQVAYAECLDSFKQRLGLSGGEDLYTLINVVMSPFPTIDGITTKICDDLKKVIEDETKNAVYRNTLSDDYHGFIMQGLSTSLSLVYLAKFFMENHRMQLVITGDLNSELKDKYDNLKNNSTNANKIFVLRTKKQTTLQKIVDSGNSPIDVEIFDDRILTKRV